MDINKEMKHFQFILDHKPKLFLGWLLYKLFRRATVNEPMKERLKKMHKEGSIVYAIKYRGQLDYLLYHFNFRTKRLPYPKLAFDLKISWLLPFSQWIRILINKVISLIKYRRLPDPYQSGFYKEAVKQGIPSLMFLVDPKGFSKRFIHSEKNHIHYLIDIQKDMDKPIFIVPQLILYSKNPEKAHPGLVDIFFGFKENPGLIRKVVVFFRYRGKAFIDFGEPINLKTLLEEKSSHISEEDIAKEVNNRLIESIDNQKRVILGPIMKSRQELKEIVLLDQVITDTVKKLANNSNKKQRALKKQAGEYFDEIAADYNNAYVQFFRTTLRWLWKKIFDDIDVDEKSLAMVREQGSKGNFVYVPSHKSHIDYLILNYVLYDHHMHIPRVAAGQNLAFWPMGHLFRKSGAFFIRRSFKNQKLYMEVFNRYIKALLEEGHPIEFYIEGGRSRNGKLISPKTGFLSILINAFLEDYSNDLIFVPTSIIYDRIIEEKSYLKELGGVKKESENFGQMFRARRFLRRRYGKIYIRFDGAFSLKDYIRTANPPEGNLHRDIANHIIKSINNVTPVTPLVLVALAILTNHRKGFYFPDLLDTVRGILDFLNKIKAPLPSAFSNPEDAVKEALSLLMEWDIVNSMEDIAVGEETFYYVEDDKKLKLEYYKNNIIHFFIPHGFVAISLLLGTKETKEIEAVRSDYLFMKNLLKKEFIFNEEDESKEKIYSIMNYFEASSFISRSETDWTYRVTEAGYKNLPIWAALIKTFLESYWIALKAVSQEEEGEINRNLILKKMTYLGNRLQKLGTIEHIGSISQLNYKNALTFINENLMDMPEGSETKSINKEKLLQIASRLYEISNFR